MKIIKSEYNLIRGKNVLPTVYLSEESKNYLEKLRRKVPAEKVPTLKRTVGLSLEFIRDREEEFIDWVKEKLRG